LDQLLRVKPNISTLSAEAYALFSNNQTAAWLNSKSSADREKIVQQARIEAVKTPPFLQFCKVSLIMSVNFANFYAR
jgi:hypothetical protein